MVNLDLKGYRALAKMFGGKCLSGTSKQKNWAEKIRAEIIASSKDDDEDIEWVVGSDFSKTAKFWIENRINFSFSVAKKDRQNAVGWINENYEEFRRIREVHLLERKGKEYKEICGNTAFPDLQDYNDFILRRVK